MLLFPAGCDASVKVEDVEVRQNTLILRNPISAHENFRGAGEDFFSGQTVLTPGIKIEPHHILTGAALGTPELSVYRKIKVAVLGTGKELVSYNSVRPLNAGEIYDATGPFLKSSFERMGCEVKHWGRVGDDPQHFFAAMKEILSSRPDLILTTGAISMGVHDFVHASVRDLGGEVLFHKVAIRPGKPILFAQFPGGPVLFGLPGNPVSTFVGVRFFVEPYLRLLFRRLREASFYGRLLDDVEKPEGIRCFFKVCVEYKKEGPEVKLLNGQPSFMISPLLKANAWAVARETGAYLEKGSAIELFPLHGES